MCSWKSGNNWILFLDVGGRYFKLLKNRMMQLFSENRNTFVKDKNVETDCVGCYCTSDERCFFFGLLENKENEELFGDNEGLTLATV